MAYRRSVKKFVRGPLTRPGEARRKAPNREKSRPLPWRGAVRLGAAPQPSKAHILSNGAWGLARQTQRPRKRSAFSCELSGGLCRGTRSGRHFQRPRRLRMAQLRQKVRHAGRKRIGDDTGCAVTQLAADALQGGIEFRLHVRLAASAPLDLRLHPGWQRARGRRVPGTWPVRPRSVLPILPGRLRTADGARDRPV